MLRHLFAFLVLAGASLWPPAEAPAQQPRPEFETGQVTIETQHGGSFTFDVELALNRGQQTYGLMFVEDMPQDAGMLFIFPEEGPRSFWMRNTLIPLDMIFIRADGTIANVVQRAEPQTDTPRRSDGPVAAVLEVNGGLTALLGIAAGDRVILEGAEGN
ncbi:MAG: DUF192 domain-containing protein [Rhodospirillaceae bacterium]|nr:DUF192 domain-containing protein [Rhodospirillaceae bacterium]